MDEEGKARHSWLNAPPTPLIDSLFASGLVNPGTSVVENTKPFSNLKPPPPPPPPQAFIPKPKPQRPSTSYSLNPGLARSPDTQLPRFQGRTVVSRGVIPKSRERRISAPDMEKYLSTKKKVIGKREAYSIATEYKQMIKDIEETHNSSAEGIEAGYLENLIKVHFYIWNSLNLQIRSYSEEYAKLYNQIKLFFQNQFDQLPQLNFIFQQEQEKLREKIVKTEEKAKSMDERLALKDAVIQELEQRLLSESDAVDVEKKKTAALQEEYNNLLYAKENVEGLLKEFRFKLSKAVDLQEMKDKEIANYLEMIEQTKAQIKNQEELIAQYEEKGAGFQAKYISLLADFDALKKEKETMSIQMAEMVPKQVTEDAEVQTVAIIPEMKKESGGKGRTRRGTVNKKHMHTNRGHSELNSTLPTTEQERSSLKSIQQADSLASVDEDADNTSSIKTIDSGDNEYEESHGTPLGESETSARESFRVAATSQAHALSRAAASTRAIGASKLAVGRGPPSRIGTGRHPAQSPFVATPSTDFDNFSPSPSLPDDYKIDNEEILHSKTVTGYVYKLFAISFDRVAQVTSSKFITQTMKVNDVNPRSYFWLISFLSEFYRSASTSFGGTVANTEFNSVLTDYITTICGNTSVTTKFNRDLILTAQRFKLRSKAADFFLRFLMGEYASLDFVFCTLLYVLCFDYIYPPISALIEDGDIEPETPQFMIHTDVCANACNLILPNISADDLAPLGENTLVSFWDYTSLMIDSFKKSHQRFHKQVANILHIVGWDSSKSIEEPIFKDFFLILNPFISSHDISNYWKHFFLLINQLEDSAAETYYFIQFLSDIKDVAELIITVPYLDSFMVSFNRLSQYSQELLYFLRRRFTGYLPHIRQHVSPKQLPEIEAKVVRMRNALLRCDIGTALTIYSFLLQYVDVRLTEEKPFILVPDDLAQEPYDNILESIKARERLSAQILSESL